jgi:hypothetical protein
LSPSPFGQCLPKWAPPPPRNVGGLKVCFVTVGRLVKVVLVVVWVVVRDVPVNVPRTVRCRSVVVICALCAVL